MEGRSCLIIGGGMGGLFTGAFLARDGYRVTVLEKNANIGGGLQCFTRNGEKYETGMHVVGGFSKGGPLKHLCDYLGFDINVVPNDLLATVHFLAEGESFDLPCGREALTAYLISRFPADEEEIKNYFRILYKLAEEEEPKFYMKKDALFVQEHSEDFMMAADAFVAKYISNPLLRSLLCFLCPMYDGVPGRTPAYLQIMTSVLFIGDACRFASGSDELADKLADVIRSAGGEVIPSAEVSEIAVDNRSISYVRTTDGRCFTADKYVSDIHPLSLMKLIPQGALPRGFVSRLQEIPNTSSAFKIYIRPSEDRPVPFVGHPVFVYRDCNSVWNLPGQDAWPQGVCCFMTEGQNGMASHITVLSPMSFDEVKKWAEFGKFRRGEGYREWKESRSRSLMELASSVLPDLTGADCFTASPLTFRDWYGVHEGSMYGYSKDCESPALSKLSVRTKIGNLFLTGQNVNMHGIGGVPMTAIETVEAVEGNHELTNKLLR